MFLKPTTTGDQLMRGKGKSPRQLLMTQQQINPAYGAGTVEDPMFIPNAKNPEKDFVTDVVKRVFSRAHVLYVIRETSPGPREEDPSRFRLLY